MERPDERRGEVGQGLHRPPTEDLVREALERDPEDVDALFVLAALRVQQGHSDVGMSILDHVLRINPGYPGAWFFKEKLHRMRGEARQGDFARRQGEAIEK